MHGVGAQHQKLGADRLQPPRSSDESLSGFLPPSGVLQTFDVVEVDAMKEEPGISTPGRPDKQMKFPGSSNR